MGNYRAAKIVHRYRDKSGGAASAVLLPQRHVSR